jgi:hypothetical protein
MRENRLVEQNLCYHLISRLPRRTYILGVEEKDSAVAQEESVGIRSRIQFSRYYLKPLLKKGFVARIARGNPTLPMQEYKLT